MARPARLQAMAAKVAMHRRQRVRTRVASGRRTRLERSLRRSLRMRIVARAALPAMWFLFRRKLAQSFGHGVTTEALLVGGDQRGPGRIDRIVFGSLHREHVTYGAMQVRLLRHAAQFHSLVVMTTGLGAGFAHGLEAVHLARMARRALHPGHERRTRVEVHLVSRRGRHALPGAVGILLDVALGTDDVRHRAVRGNRVRALRDLDVELDTAREDRLPVAVMALQLRVFARAESLERHGHDVTPRAELVVVHHVVPRPQPGEADTSQDHKGDGGESHFPRP